MRQVISIFSVFFSLVITTSCINNSKHQSQENRQEISSQTKLVGNDRDEHGCIGSAGYQWSEVLKDCIRPFEKGIRLVAAKGDETQAAYLVFSNDSSKVEIFLPKKQIHPILTREKTMDGQIIWSEKENTNLSVRCIEKIWGIYFHDELQYVNL